MLLRLLRDAKNEIATIISYRQHILHTNISTVNRTVNNIKAFDKLPGAKKFLGLIDLDLIQCPNDKIVQLFHDRSNNFGNMWTLQPFIFAKKLLVMSSADHIQQYFECEGKYPIRALNLLTNIITAREYCGIDQGAGFQNGENWKRYRRILSNYLMKPKDLEIYLPNLNLIAKNAVNDIIFQSATDRNYAGFREQLLLWALQSVYYVVTQEIIADVKKPDNYKFVKEIQNMLRNIATIWPTIIPPKYYHSKQLKSLIKSLQYVLEFVRKGINTASNNSKLSNNMDGRKTFLNYLETSTDLNETEILSTIMDVLGGGVDTTQITTCYLWYNLARNPKVQEKLYKEIKYIIGNDEIISAEKYNKLTYLKDCIKESMRISPTLIGNIRITSRDVSIGGTLIPEGTTIIMLSSKTQMDNLNYENASKFIPERWESREGRHPYAMQPFGMGARMCVGRRLAEMEIQIVTAQLLKKAVIKVEKEPKLEMTTFIRPQGLELSFHRRE